MKTWAAFETLRSTDLNANFAECVATGTARTVTVTHTWSASQTFSGGATFGAATTVSTGGLTVTAGGLTVTAGGLTVSAGTTTVQALTATTLSMTGTLTMTAAASKLVPGATSFSHRNNADNADNLLISDAGAVTVRAGLTATSGTFGTNSASTGNVRLPYNGLINFRNAANTNDVTLALTIGSDDISMGIQANSIQLVTKLGLLAAATAGSGSDVYLGGTTQTTIGANGAASALTANPLGYLIAYKGTTKIVIPYYNG